MSNKKTQEVESLVLVSPSGHKYEICVTDSGTITTTYKENKD
jgi:hypothetical protein